MMIYNRPDWKNVLSSIDGLHGINAPLDHLRTCVERILVLSELHTKIPKVCSEDFANACSFMQTINHPLPKIVLDAAKSTRQTATFWTSIRIFVSCAKLALVSRRQTRCPPADEI